MSLVSSLGCLQNFKRHRAYSAWVILCTRTSYEVILVFFLYQRPWNFSDGDVVTQHQHENFTNPLITEANDSHPRQLITSCGSTKCLSSICGSSLVADCKCIRRGNGLLYLLLLRYESSGNWRSEKIIRKNYDGETWKNERFLLLLKFTRNCIISSCSSAWGTVAAPHSTFLRLLFFHKFNILNLTLIQLWNILKSTNKNKENI